MLYTLKMMKNVFRLLIGVHCVLGLIFLFFALFAKPHVSDAYGFGFAITAAMILAVAFPAMVIVGLILFTRSKNGLAKFTVENPSNKQRTLFIIIAACVVFAGVFLYVVIPN